MELSEQRIQQGRNLVEKLDRSGSWTVEAALWFFLSEIDCWRLVLEIKESEAIGKERIYQSIKAVLADASASGGDAATIRLLDVTVAERNSLEAAALVALRRIVGTGGGLNGIRLQSTVLDGQVIEDVFIYRL